MSVLVVVQALSDVGRLLSVVRGCGQPFDSCPIIVISKIR